MISALLLGSNNIFANLEGTWKLHPAAALRTDANKEGQVDRIIEGNRFVYFSVRGSAFKRGDGNLIFNDHVIDPLQLFVYDKSQPWQEGCIRPLAHSFELSGPVPVALNYSPAVGALVVVYENNLIDVVCDNGDLISSTALKDLSVPSREFSPYTVSFDEERGHAYVAGSFGYIVVDMADGSLVNSRLTDKPVSWVNRIGDNIVLFAGEMSPTSYASETYVYPEGSVPESLAAPVAGGANLQALMPFGSDSFAALSRGTDDAKSDLSVFTLSGGSLSSKSLVTGITVDNGSNSSYRHMFRTDGYHQPTKDGYAIFGQNAVYMLSRETGGLSATLSREKLAQTEKASKAATFDGSRLWLFTYVNSGADMSKRGFYSYDFSPSGAPGSKSDVVSVNAPLEIYANYASWNPSYGLLLRGPGSTTWWDFAIQDNLCSLKDGVWAERAFPAHNSTYNVPTRAAKFIVTDPLNLDQVWGVSVAGGLHRLDLTDYSRFVQLGTPYSNYSNWPNLYPKYYPVFDVPDGYKKLASFSEMDFDAEGNMWFAQYFPRDTYYDYEDYSLASIPLYYITPEERMNIDSQAPDVRSREIRLPRVELFHNPMLHVMKSEGRESHIVISHRSTETKKHRLEVYDFNGTPADKTDDRYTVCEEWRNEAGEILTHRAEAKQLGLYEDMQTGMLWMLTEAGPFIVDTEEVLSGKIVCKRLVISRENGIDVTPSTPFDFVEIQAIADDNLSRKWLATASGLYCLSPDAKEILGHYTADNSGLPSDNVYNVVSTPEGNVFVLTERGLAEFAPEGSAAPVVDASRLAAWPSSVAPDYRGYVNISGAQEGAAYEVYDSEGNRVCGLGTPESGRLQWKPGDIQSGRYNIRKAGSEVEGCTVVVAGK